MLQPVSDRVLGTNLQVFHRSPPFRYAAGGEPRKLGGQTAPACPASADTPACGPLGQWFYGL